MKNKKIYNSYLYCKKITKKNAKNFYYSFYLLPRKKRFAMYVLYTFCRKADDIADEGNNDEKKFEAFKDYEKKLENTLKENVSDDELFIGLNDILQKYKFNHNNFFQLIEGVKMDTIKKRYNDFKELYYYCYKVAGTVSLMCFDIFIQGEKKPIEYGLNLGLALQLTNIIRDIKEDKDNGRIYLPLEDLKKFNYSEEDLINEKVNNNFFDLIKFQIQRAKDYYKLADESFPTEHKKDLYTLSTIKDLYYNLLLEIEKEPELLYQKRFSLPACKKIFISIKNYF
jgi:15-cis-phytoene synthase